MTGFLDVVSNIFMAFPPFLVAITLVGLFESKVFSIILSIVIAMWVWNARVVRTYVLRGKNKKPYVYHLPDVRLFRTEDYIPAYYSKCPSTSFW